MSKSMFDTGAGRGPSTDIVPEFAHQDVGAGRYCEHGFGRISVQADDADDADGAGNFAGHVAEISTARMCRQCESNPLRGGSPRVLPPLQPSRRQRVLRPRSGGESRRPAPALGRALALAGKP